MKGAICAAVDTSTAIGLRLAGVDEVIAWQQGDDAARLRGWYRSMLSGGISVLVLSAKAASALSGELLEKRTSGQATPVIVVLPGDGEDRRAMEMMRRAVGMEHGHEKGGS